ncbi:MAG: 4-hydroxythreonine-4-phosphate dehydrogenase PdxA [Cyclobacteriaceae bacterium]
MSQPNKNPIQDKPLIGISIGDINGIGPEIIIKALSDPRILRYFTPIVYCSAKVIGFYRKIVNEDFVYNQINDLGGINPKKVNVYNIWNESFEITPGEVNEIGGKYALLSLTRATEDLKNGKLDALVTAPINKDNIQSDEFQFPGHTEFLASTFEVEEHLMLMVANNIRIGVATGHIPLKDVAASLTAEKIKNKVKVMIKSLKREFGISKPRIAVLGLNPHAGENGLLGSEEQEILQPAIEELKNSGQLVFGPFPADGFFGTMEFKKFDGVLAMYHDQGLTPFKYMAFEDGVNFTAGLPAIRTSPDHGTAYNIAGKNIANENSMRAALYLAADMVATRKESEPVPT